MLFSLFIYALFAFLLFYGIRFQKNDSEPVYFQSFNALRGLFALEIVVGHVIRYESTLLYPLGKFMIISVAFFFFVSGWGLCRSFHTKDRYLEHFLLPKCGYLLALSLIAYLIRILVFLCSGRLHFDRNIFQDYLSCTNWYIWELLFFYLLFYLIYKYVKKYRILLIALITFSAITAVFFIDMPQGYYSSALAFPAGLLFYEYFSAVTGFFQKPAGKILVFLTSLLGLSSLLLGADSLLGMVYLRNLMCLSALCILFYVLTYFEVNNLFLKKLGKYSTEIYLYQFIFLELFSAQSDWRIRMLLVCFLTLLTAVILHPIHVLIRKTF